MTVRQLTAAASALTNELDRLKGGSGPAWEELVRDTGDALMAVLDLLERAGAV